MAVWHWLILAIWIVIVGYPFSRILRRAGHSAWWTVAFLVPLLNIVALWVLAFVPWPVVARTQQVAKF